VIGVFSSSFYLRMDGGGLVLFHLDRFGLVPFGVGLPEMDAVLRSLRARPDARFSCRGLELTFPEAGLLLILKPKTAPPSKAPDPGPRQAMTARWNVESEAVIAELNRADAFLRGRKPGFVRELRGLLRAEDAGGEPGGARIGSLWEAPAFSELACGMRNADESRMASALRGLVGLGTGLTPTMDDVLAGMVYAFSFAGRNGVPLFPGVPDFRRLLADPCAGWTTEISGAYLQSAASGEMFSLLEVLASALTGGCAENGCLEGALESLLDVGSDSGANMAAGILLGISLIIDSINVI